jgi:basic membrane lipoprotein Med (substrate-binding protein (PBP1-ABC) superfamily)
MNTMNRVVSLLLVLAFVSSCIENVNAQGPAKIAVCVGTSDKDGRGTYMQDAMNGGVQGCGGAQEAVAEFEETNPGVYDGPLCYVTYYFIDDADQGGTDESCDQACVVDKAIADGNELIIGVSFAYTGAIADAAAANPDLDFGVVDVSYNPPIENVEAFVWKEDQSGFLAGIVAGEVARESGRFTLGAVGGLPIPPVLRFINGFIVGARDACPQCTIYEVYSTSWSDIEQAHAHANLFLENGVGIAFCAGGFTGSQACLKMAQNGVYVIGVDVDEYYSTYGAGTVEGVENLLTSAQKSTARAIQYSIQCFLFRFEDCAGRTNTLDASNNGIVLSPCHESCELYGPTTQAKVADLYQALKDDAISTGVDPDTGLLMIGETVDLTAESP